MSVWPFLWLLGFFLPHPLWAQPPAFLTHGVASGDVTHRGAVLWARASRATTLHFALGTTPRPQGMRKVGSTVVGPLSDLTGTLTVEGLTPSTRYYYRVGVSEGALAGGGPPDSVGLGTFVTAPAPEEEGPVTFLWSGDLGGQGFCRQPEYHIFRTMARRRPDFFLFVGDTIYADKPCPHPPNIPGGDFVATTLEGFRAKYRYSRADPPLQAFLASTSVYGVWDDHEVSSDFSGPTEPLMLLGRQAFLEYYPIRRFPQDPYRLYRKFCWGKALELFLLDTRQYRDPNRKRDGPDKTMLGKEQLRWLLSGLARSQARWKMIVSSVPLSVPTGSWAWFRGHDGWAKSFESELLSIVDLILTQPVRPVVWISADIHMAQVIAYDPDQDGRWDFYEFTSGPLSAGLGKPRPLDPTLNPHPLYRGSGFYNFGLVRIKGQELQVQIQDEEGGVRFTQTLKGAASPASGGSGEGSREPSAPQPGPDERERPGKETPRSQRPEHGEGGSLPVRPFPEGAGP